MSGPGFWPTEVPRTWILIGGGLALAFASVGLLLFGRGCLNHGGYSADPEDPRSRTVDALSNLPFAPSAEIAALLDESRQVADRLVERFPNDPRAYDIAGSIHYRLGEVDVARKLWEECLALDQGYFSAQFSLGTLLFESGDFAEAEVVLVRGLQQSPGNPQGVYLLGSSLLNQGKLAEVVELLEANRSGGSAPVPNLVLLGQAYLQLQQPDKAWGCFLEAIQAAPEYANAYFGLATAYVRLGQNDEAARYRKKFRDLQRQQLRDGIEQDRGYNDLRSTSFELAETWFAAANLYASRGDLQAAEQAVQHALRLDPDNAQYQKSLAAIREDR